MHFQTIDDLLCLQIKPMVSLDRSSELESSFQNYKRNAITTSQRSGLKQMY